MPKVYKTVGQSAPAANTDTTVYTVPASTQFVGSTITVCNRDSNVVSSYRIAIVPSGATLASQHYIVYEKTNRRQRYFKPYFRFGFISR